ncbi:hypothetical protein [uncultured Dokdonia sp.]|uniref:hypothetical protein n=1 Tax=uncultured Dokdonia sp. TaxID=575653 RepID=UPI002633F5F9|nr:hypothetical protein [uncultured Dokdonia sp.]
MTEIERIQQNINGEIPEEDYDILKIIDIPNPEKELETFKQTIATIIQNINLHEEDSKWENLLPEPLIRFTNQLVEYDYYKDELISHITSMVYDVKKVREWEWYSSKLHSSGFDVIMKGVFRGIFTSIIHHQGIRHESIIIRRKDKEYPIIRSGIDVLRYRNWNPETLVLSKGEYAGKYGLR